MIQRSVSKTWWRSCVPQGAEGVYSAALGSRSRCRNPKRLRYRNRTSNSRSQQI